MDSSDVLHEWVKRGYITTDQAETDRDKYLSYIDQTKYEILSYCNIPILAQIPEGLFYVWVGMAWEGSQGLTAISGSGAVKSVTEGDTTVQFDVGTTVTGTAQHADYYAMLNRYRRLPL